jgi:replication factor C large subunit
MTWNEKYRPRRFEDVKGQSIVIEKVKTFVNDFTNKKGKNAIILHGPPGTGKTSLAYVIANETNSEIFELNASDFRNRERLEETLKPAIEQHSLIPNQKKIILVDEVDGLSATDRGGLKELLDLMKITTWPIIITANQIWNKKFASLRQASELYQLKEVNYQTIKQILIEILRKENLFIENQILTTISIKAKGDIRAAINDLESIANLFTGKKEIKYTDIKLDERNKEKDIFNALRLIFKGKPNSETLKAFDEVNMNLDEVFLWIEENIPYEYKGEELAKACEAISKADIFKGRIYKQQYWRFLIYQSILLSYGISASKKEIKTGFTSYKKPTRILKIWMNNQRNAKKKSISTKYASIVHVGSKRAMSEFPIIKQIIKQNPKIKQELKLSEDEIDYLEK